LEIQTRKILDRYLQFNPGNLREFAKNTKALLTKVEGGRCRNNRPTDIFVRRKIKGKYDANLICDIDISGCYGEGQRNQLFAIGNPLTFGFDITKYSENDYPTLRQTLKMFDVDVDALIKGDNEAWTKAENLGELVPGLWYWRITVKEEDLKYPQDFFASWFTDSGHGVDVLAKFIKSMGSDTEYEDLENSQFDEEYGNLKIFNHQIHNAVLTHDGLQWILKVASARQRNELLDKIVVLTGALYPRSERIECDGESAVKELDAVYDKWEGKNNLKIFKQNNRFVVQNNQEECHGWYGVNMGELIVDKLLIERKKAQKTEGKKSPLDLLFKLAVNTLYGDMVSKFFSISNPVVGNNITARARALAWYMEKGLYGWQSITDGCAFELNGVMFPKRDVIDGESINQHRKDSKLNSRNQSRVPLGNAEEIKGHWVEKQDKGETYHELNLVIVNKDGSETELTGSKATEWVDKVAMEHLQNLFPCTDVLQSPTTGIKIKSDLSVEYFPRVGQFSFETKDVYHSGAFHGSANYLLVNPNNPEDKPIVKARGYELKREHESYSLEDLETLVENDRYGEKNNPARDLLKQLLDNAKFVQRQDPAIKQGILKIGDYAEHPDKYEELGLEVGDNIKKCFLMQEFSLTQFTFKTYEQYHTWKKVIDSYKDKGKQSLEAYFQNPDGSINFVALVEWVDNAIANDVMNPFKAIDGNRNKQRTTKEEGTTRKKFDGNPHPKLETYQKIQRRLSKRVT
jgi:hypothetical protein